jgi:hypothetical protein
MASRIVPEGGWSNLKPFRTPRELKPSHLSFIKRLPCICCLASVERIERYGCDPAHIRTESRMHGKPYTGMGEKPSDRFTLPLCRMHHDQQHSMSEMKFWSLYRIDPHLLALILWGLTGDEHAANEVIRLHAMGGL